MNRAVYRMRSEIVEPVFGWIKQAWSFRRWTVRGLDKARAQWRLICTATNLLTLWRTWSQQPQHATAASPA